MSFVFALPFGWEDGRPWEQGWNELSGLISRIRVGLWGLVVCINKISSYFTRPNQMCLFTLSLSPHKVRVGTLMSSKNFSRRNLWSGWESSAITSKEKEQSKCHRIKVMLWIWLKTWPRLSVGSYQFSIWRQLCDQRKKKPGNEDCPGVQKITTPSLAFAPVCHKGTLMFSRKYLPFS